MDSEPSLIRSEARHPLRVVVAHTHYRQPGGEDEVFHAECDLLEQHGHAVHRHTALNDHLTTMTPVGQARATIWNSVSYRAMRDLLRRHRSDVLHVHNTFPLMSPSVIHAAAAEGVPVVQTLHNFRLVCPAGSLFRDGRFCNECVERAVAWPGVRHGCYQGSRLKTAVVAAAHAYHWRRRTWPDLVNRFVVMTEYARAVVVQAGVPEHKVVVKPHFVSPAWLARPGDGGSYALNVGRLEPGKGVQTLLDAWRADIDLPLKIVGDGPLAGLVELAARERSGIDWMGRLPRSGVQALMRDAKMVVFPSTAAETFGLVIIEAYASGVPVIASDIAAAVEIVDHGTTGLLFPAGDAEALRSQVKRMLGDPAASAAMSAAARNIYESRYSAEANYSMLMDVYQSVIADTG